MSRTCACCGGQLSQAFATPDLNRRVSERVFHYGHCRDCGSYQLLDPPEDLGAYYSTAYYSDLREGGETELAHHQLDLVPAALSGRIIEIGPADGAMLRLARARGFAERAAVERDPGCCARLRADGVETVETEDPVTGLAELAPADAVVMLHLIEHVPDPMRLLDAAASKVKPGGMLVVSTPNPHAFSFSVCRARWTHIDAPRHLFLLPARVITDRLGRSGLGLASLTTRDPIGLLLDTLPWGPWSHGIIRNPRAAYYLRAAIRNTALLVERLPLRGSTYTAVYARPA